MVGNEAFNLEWANGILAPLKWMWKWLKKLDDKVICERWFWWVFVLMGCVLLTS